MSLNEERINELRAGDVVVLPIPKGVTQEEAKDEIALAAIEHKLELRRALYASSEGTGYLVWLDDTATPPIKERA